MLMGMHKSMFTDEKLGSSALFPFSRWIWDLDAWERLPTSLPHFTVSSSLLVDLSGADPTRVGGEVELNGVRLTSAKDVVDGTTK